MPLFHKERRRTEKERPPTEGGKSEKVENKGGRTDVAAGRTWAEEKMKTAKRDSLIQTGREGREGERRTKGNRGDKVREGIGT